MRCGKPLVHQYLGEDCVPDFVCIGKCVQCGMVLQRGSSDARTVQGMLTSIMDWMVLHRIITILQQVSQRQLISQIETKGPILSKHFANLGIEALGLGFMFCIYGARRCSVEGVFITVGDRFLPHLSYLEETTADPARVGPDGVSTAAYLEKTVGVVHNRDCCGQLETCCAVRTSSIKNNVHRELEYNTKLLLGQSLNDAKQAFVKDQCVLNCRTCCSECCEDCCQWWRACRHRLCYLYCLCCYS